jgi:hypothetical protein
VGYETRHRRDWRGSMYHPGLQITVNCSHVLSRGSSKAPKGRQRGWRNGNRIERFGAEMEAPALTRADH